MQVWLTRVSQGKGNVMAAPKVVTFNYDRAIAERP